MSSDARWAARYQFLEDVWRGRDRLIFDPAVVAAVRSGPDRMPEPVRDLFGALVTRGGDGRVALAADDDLVASLGDGAEGIVGRAQVVPIVEVAERLRGRPWEVAMVDLTALLAVEGSEEGPEAILSVLAEGASGGKSVVLMASAADDPSQGDGVDFDRLATVLAQRFGGGRVYGLYLPDMVAAVEFETVDASFGQDEGVDDGEVDEGEDEVDGDPIEVDDEEDGDDEDEDDVPVSFDNTLGEQEPVITHYLALCGEGELEDGMTLLELPATETRGLDAQPRADRGLRAQLQEARRQSDLVAIERQNLVDRIDQLESDRDVLEETVARLRDDLARALHTGGAPAAVAPAIQPADAPEASPSEDDGGAEAREQSLRWELAKLQDELAALRKRPVDALEAEVASLRARLAAGVGAGGADTTAHGPTVPTSAGASSDGDGDRAAVVPAKGLRDVPAGDLETQGGLATPKGRARKAGLRALDALARRVERQGIGALELRRALLHARRLLDR